MSTSNTSQDTILEEKKDNYFSQESLNISDSEEKKNTSEKEEEVKSCNDDDTDEIELNEEDKKYIDTYEQQNNPEYADSFDNGYEEGILEGVQEIVNRNDSSFKNICIEFLDKIKNPSNKEKKESLLKYINEKW